MAPGYGIALACEAAGLVGLLVALRMIRQERRSRSAGLRSFLRSGQSPDAGPAARPAPPARRVDLPVVPARPGIPAPESFARSALRRALARPDARGPGAGRTGREPVEAAAV